MAAQINAFEATGGRAVLIGRHYAHGDAVIHDSVGGARELARMFVNAGHRSIGVISGPSNLTSTHDRLAGFRMGLRDSGLELDEAAVVTGDFTRDGGERSVQDLVLQAPDLTAIFALNDVIAIRALSGLRLLEKPVADA